MKCSQFILWLCAGDVSLDSPRVRAPPVVMASRSQLEHREQPFQVVTQKRSSAQGTFAALLKVDSTRGQLIKCLLNYVQGMTHVCFCFSVSSLPGRRGAGQDKALSSRSQQSLTHPDDSNSAGGSTQRKRQSPGSQMHTARDAGKQQLSLSRPNHSHHSDQSKAPPRDQERDREGGSHGGHYRNRHHSWESEALNTPKMSDKIERHSARCDRLAGSNAVVTAETSNRFDRLNPDTEALCNHKPSGGRSRRRMPRNSAGSAAYRSQSPKRKSGKEGKGGREHKDSREKPREEETDSSIRSSVELEWDAPVPSARHTENQSTAGSLREEGELAVSFSGSESAELEEQERGDKMYRAVTKSDSLGAVPNNTTDLDSSKRKPVVENAEGDVEGAGGSASTRVIYTRVCQYTALSTLCGRESVYLSAPAVLRYSAYRSLPI